MLTGLTIRDIVLIERLDLAVEAGLSVLTGETGAGKSIVLDALGLALGGRADRGLVRSGASQGSVAAWFRVPGAHPAHELLREQAIETEDEIVVRRTLGSDGRSRAFINDQPVSGQSLRRLGATLVEVHGQNDQQGLLDAGQHRALLDAFAGLGPLASEVVDAWQAWQAAIGEQARLVGEVERLRGEEDYLRHRAAELGELAPQLGEEEALAAQRQRLAGSDKLASVLGEIVGALGEGPAGARERLAAAQRRLERSGAALDPAVAPVRDALERALIELDEVEAALAAAAAAIDADPDALERVENRLFALRDAARKHRVPIDGLPALLADTEAALAGIERGGEALAAAEAATAAARAHYRAAAERLTKGRRGAAERLATAVTAELAPLKLEQARFRVALTPLAEPDWGTQGAERVTFEVATNPGQPFGALARIASGGELSRLMLALKVVLARLGEAPTLIFDEIDAGIGGATADAVGERLARLGRERQVLVVTHAPQVAARADHHLTVAKRSHGERTMVEVRTLDQTARRREIARMLAGAEITEAAQAAAASLLVSAGRS